MNNVWPSETELIHFKWLHIKGIFGGLGNPRKTLLQQSRDALCNDF